VIVDSSALVAVIRNEPDARLYFDAMVSARGPQVSAANLLESAIVADGRGPVGARKFDQLVAGLDLDVVPVDADHVAVARQAYRDFGRGSGHPARLNFGDCFAYALASVTGESLLYKGDDFNHTDVRSALA
jgi:ribonuclease VapC